MSAAADNRFYREPSAARTLPLVHLNGTSRGELLESYIDSSNAVRHALEIVRRNAPNARDYYPLGTGKAEAAMREHEERCAKLSAVLEELTAIGEHVAGLT